MKLPKIFVPDKDLENQTESLLKEINPSFQLRYKKLICTDTYAKGIVKLKKQGKKPFTFAENIEARITDYESKGKNARLFDTWLDSVTGIACKAKSTKFKLILRCSKLENIKSDFNKSFIQVDYVSEQGIEFDSREGKYNQLLTREEAENHEFWLAALGGNKELLEKYVDIWFDKTGKEKGMGVYLRSYQDIDELRALGLDYDYESYVTGVNLNSRGCFISGAQQK